MNLINNVIINSYSALLLILIYLQSLRHVDSRTLQHRMYKALLFTTFFVLIFDTMGRFDGNPGTYFSVFNHAGNFLLYLFNQLVPALWLIYVGSQVYQRNDKIKNLCFIILAVFMLNAVFLLITQFQGFYYYIDENNIYHRGDYNFVPYVLTLSLIVVATIIIFMNRKLMQKKQFVSLLSFSVLPMLCFLIQSFVYGLSLMFFGVTIALLIIYFNIQNHTIFTDYLTDLNNRMKLEFFLKEKIAAATPAKTFAAIMLDINNFKSINDVYGHSTGDEILRRAAKLLRSCVCPDDFIARFGGDEFFIVVDAFDYEQLQVRIDKINLCINRYNETTEDIYKIEFSMGYKVYDPETKMSSAEFQKQLDILMYADKQDYKNRQKSAKLQN